MTEIATIFASSFQRAPWGWALTAMVLLGLIRVWPALSKQAIEARAQMRAERRTDLTECQRRLDDVSRRLDLLNIEFNNLKIELAGTLSAYRILEIEVEHTNPKSLGLAEARAVLSAAFTVAPSTTGQRSAQ